MNYFDTHLILELNRQRLREASKQRQIEKMMKEVRQARNQRWQSALAHVADWMIETGKRIHTRNDMPAKKLDLERPA